MNNSKQVLPFRVSVYNPGGIRLDGAYVDKILKEAMVATGKTRPPLAGEFPEDDVERIEANDIFAAVNELFYKRGWTDGLPVVPPIEERVKAMLLGTDLPPYEVSGVVNPIKGQAPVEKIAVNAVMAGCRPEYMPVLIAAVQAIIDPSFNLIGLATTTSPDTPMLIINGPIAQRLDINSGTNALGRGWQANATIGRALNLIINNIGGSRPGITDMSCLGQPGEFAMALAENEDANPWEPLHVELGYTKETNVVTVIAAEGIQGILGIGLGSEELLDLVADRLLGSDTPYRPAILLIIAQDTAAMLARDGWTKEKIRQFIFDRARMPFLKYKKRFIDTNLVGMMGGVPSWVSEVKDHSLMIPVPFVDQFLIIVSGGPGEKSMLIPVWPASTVISKEIMT